MCTASVYACVFEASKDCPTHLAPYGIMHAWNAIAQAFKLEMTMHVIISNKLPVLCTPDVV